MKQRVIVTLGVSLFFLSACGNSRIVDTSEKTINTESELFYDSENGYTEDIALHDNVNRIESVNTESNCDIELETEVLAEEEGESKELIIMRVGVLDKDIGKYEDIRLEAFSLETGQSREIAVFPNYFNPSDDFETTSVVKTFPLVECRNGNFRDIFSEDYSMVAAIRPCGNSEHHCGWIDENGTFTDITEKIREKFPYNYGHGLSHFPMGFEKDYFYFKAIEYTNESTMSWIFYRMRVGDETGESLECTGTAGSLDNYYEINNQENRVWDETVGITQNYNERFHMTDWLDENRLIGDALAVHLLPESQELTCESHIVIFDTQTKEISPLIPKEYGMSRNGIISPDGKSVAFLMDPTSNQFDGTGIYIKDLSSDKITPVKFDLPEQFVNGFYDIEEDGLSIKLPELSLLEWR